MLAHSRDRSSKLHEIPRRQVATVVQQTRPCAFTHQVSSAFFSRIIYEIDRSETLIELLIRQDGDGSVELDALFRRLRKDDGVHCSCGCATAAAIA